jgi:hypothetical protein
MTAIGCFVADRLGSFHIFSLDVEKSMTIENKATSIWYNIVSASRDERRKRGSRLPAYTGGIILRSRQK